jgi:ATP-dependent Clp protease ATP-binding subunit ClpA
MPKVNVYLPDDLADAVRDTGVPVSAVCQRALEQAVRRITVIRRTVLTDLDDLPDRLPQFTARAVTVVQLAAGRAREDGAASVGTGDVLRALFAEGENLALRILAAMDIDPATLTVAGADPAGDSSDALRFSPSAAAAMEMAVSEATALGHNYVGTEHMLIGLAAEPDGVAGRALRAAGTDAKAVRRAVSAAVAGYAAGSTRAQSQATPAAMAGVLADAVRQEVAPLIRRIEALEARAA